MSQVFPITLPATENIEGRVSYASEFMGVFRSVRPKGMIWYAYDVEIVSPTRVKFRVYDMREPLWGGLGKVVGILEADVHPSVTDRSVRRRCRILAVERRNEELQEAEELIVKRYENELYEGVTKSRSTERSDDSLRRED